DFGRHVLAPRGRSGIRPQDGHACRAAAHWRASETRARGGARVRRRIFPRAMRQREGTAMRKVLIGIVLAGAFAMISLTLVGKSLPKPTGPTDSKAATDAHAEDAFAAVVTVARVAPADFTGTVLASGSLVAREEILVGPEVEGLRVTEVLTDEGMRVKRGDVLARLVADTLDAQLAQNAFERAKPLKAAGHMAESAYDNRQQAARTAEAQLVAARDGLKVAEAEKAQIEAQRRELNWRRGRTEVVAPADGIVSRRMARVGGYAAGAAEPMFRIVANGEVELDAEVTETRMAAVKVGQPARVEVAGVGEVVGTVRLVSPEVDKATR